MTRVLVLGAGAIGGYFGGRLIQAKRDVTFLVRPARAAQLAAIGLVIKSPARGDVTIPKPQVVLATDKITPYDIILLSCKSYDLESAIESIAPAVGPGTLIVPMLNGMRHMDVLDARFGREHVLGGLCTIAATLGPQGEIMHLNDRHGLTFGDRTGAPRPDVAAVFVGAGFDGRETTVIVEEMWEKWVFLAALASLTCLMRGSIGDIIAVGGLDIGVRLYEDCRAIATANGFAPRAAAIDMANDFLHSSGSKLTASMMRDVERGAHTEADHVLGDLISRGSPEVVERSLLRIAYLHLLVYERRRHAGSGR